VDLKSKLGTRNVPWQAPQKSDADWLADMIVEKIRSRNGNRRNIKH